MAAAAAGASDALDQLYRRYGASLRGYFRRFETRDSTADDLVQDTFIRVLRYGASYDSRRPFRGWLFTIARNVALQARAARPHAVNLDDVVLTASGDPAREYRTREALAALSDAIGTLGEEDRRVIVLGKVEGRSYREIGHGLGITEGAAKVRMFRALERLRQRLRELDNPGGWLNEH